MRNHALDLSLSPHTATQTNIGVLSRLCVNVNMDVAVPLYLFSHHVEIQKKNKCRMLVVQDVDVDRPCSCQQLPNLTIAVDVQRTTV
jgi:hypothetical protein